MGTFFDARTRIAHFRSKRTHERTAHPTTPPRLINTECLACRASLLAFTRVVRATSKKIHARASSATTTTSPRRARSFSSSSRNEKMRIEKETPPNSRLSRLRLADSTFCDRSIDVDGDGDTADARARVAVSFDRHARERRPRTSATRDVQKKTLSSLPATTTTSRFVFGTGRVSFSISQTNRPLASEIVISERSSASIPRTSIRRRRVADS